jgi:hypothetical protein
MVRKCRKNKRIDFRVVHCLGAEKIVPSTLLNLVLTRNMAVHEIDDLAVFFFPFFLSFLKNQMEGHNSFSYLFLGSVWFPRKNRRKNEVKNISYSVLDCKEIIGIGKISS